MSDDSGIESAPTRLTIDVTPREIGGHLVLDAELDALRDASPNAALAWVGIGIGAALSSFATLVTATLTPTTTAVFAAALIIAVVVTAWFGLVAYRSARKADDVITKIRAGRGSPAN